MKNNNNTNNTNIVVIGWRYHELLEKGTDKTKEENRELNQIIKDNHKRGLNKVIDSIEELENVSVLRYPTVEGLYRIQCVINNKVKTIARVKIAKKDAYILIRETTARELKKDYEIINYNLPAGYHVEKAGDLYNDLVDIINYHTENQTA